jgi:hypothetical protein
MTESRKEIAKNARQLSALAGLLVVGYFCNDKLRFAVDFLNSIFECALCAIPFLAIRPVRRLHQWPKVLGLIVLAPLLLYSSFHFLGRVVFGRTEHTQTLQAVQQGGSTIELQDYENGGSVGVHGLNLEQRRLIVPGLYLVKSVDFFDSAREGTLSVEGPYTVRVHAKGNYQSNDYQVDKTYRLKPWVYF